MDFTFPFNTCEKTNKDGISQLYSVFVNLISCIIIFYFLCKTKHIYTFLFLFAILCFELFHVFSHAIHMNKYIYLQTNIIHVLTYTITISLFLCLYNYTKIIPNDLFLFYLFLLVLFDIFALFHLSVFYYVLSQALLIISLMSYYLPLLPLFIQKSIYQIIFFIIISLLLLLNEIYNCKKMMQVNPDFPYHIFLEISLMALFYAICSNFYKL
jgi:hypothetical protein